ncbi:MAG: DNA-directed RNA polymerase subunit omega [Nitrospiraceae bacterium]|nr:DNA-directed RNA polymerase subunit omega [Nitrospira sp.]MCA9457929.1 DNA-directed RNA polymerase subunit omega [Nitrospira sp.]MCB9773201.1 DNA-directed RNA polymerase subunit omega [Nitrospiraceae bacterium]
MDALSLLPQHHQKEFDSRYRIVLIAAQRAKQLVRGGEPYLASKFSKDTSRALEEVLNGQVPYLIGQEAKEAIKIAKRANERPIDPALYAQPDENAQEIKKELSVYIDDTAQHLGTVVEPEEA